MKPQNKTVLQNALALWGKDDQIGMFHEEIGELMKAINKHRRNPTEENRLKVQDETADVKIMLAQIELMFGSADDYQAAKMERLAGRVEKAMRKYLAEGSLNVRFGSIFGINCERNPKAKFSLYGVQMSLEPQQIQDKAKRVTIDYLERMFAANKVKLDPLRPFGYTNDIGNITTKLENREQLLPYIVNTLCTHGIETEFVCYVDKNYIALAPQVRTAAQIKQHNEIMSADKFKD